MIRRVRYAPSPTGDLHIGGLRTALYNWLFCKQNKQRDKSCLKPHQSLVKNSVTCLASDFNKSGFFIRIENTDKVREVSGSSQRIIDTLKIFGIESDAPIQQQSENKHFHQEYAQKLLKQGHAYPCFCSNERLKKIREKILSGLYDNVINKTILYDRHCRKIKPEDAEKRIKMGEPYTLRLKVPLNGTTIVDDGIHGKVEFQNSSIDDQILLKNDGFPTYHLASVIDDHFLGITHVIRGDEWLSSTPKHIMLYNAFGWKLPEFIHLPLLLNPDRSKISKRQNHSSVESILKSTKGYLPSALLNFVTLLGWSPINKNTNKHPENLNNETLENLKHPLVYLNKEDILKDFNIYRCSVKGVVVNMNFLHFLNKQHMMQLDKVILIQYLREWYQKNFGKIDREISDNYIRNILEHILPLISGFDELTEYSKHFLDFDLTNFSRSTEKVSFFVHEIAEPETLLLKIHDIISEQSKNEKKWNPDYTQMIISNTTKLIRQECNDLNQKKAMLFLRWVVTGSVKGPTLPIVFSLLGKNRTLERINFKI